MLWEMLRLLDGVVVTNVDGPACNVVWPCLCSDVTADSFYGILLFVRDL